MFRLIEENDLKIIKRALESDVIGNTAAIKIVKRALLKENISLNTYSGEDILLESHNRNIKPAFTEKFISLVKDNFGNADCSNCFSEAFSQAIEDFKKEAKNGTAKSKGR